MTLTTKRALRQIQLMEYGFGPDIMGLTKVCPCCGKGNPAECDTCADCGAALGDQTLLDLYRSRHPSCPCCGGTVSRAALYCPDCGTRLKRGKAAV